MLRAAGARPRFRDGSSCPLAGSGPPGRPRRDAPVHRHRLQRRAGDGDIRIPGPRRGRVLPVVLVRALGVPSAAGPVERVVGSLSDSHERRSLEDRLRENALYDTLTGLPNRRLFLSQLDQALALWHRDKTPFAVIFLDLDGFKAINDSLGHQMGDRVLNAVGARICLLYTSPSP